MSTRDLFLAVSTSFALILAGFAAAADDDIPGVVIVEDEDDSDDPIAFSDEAQGKVLGKLENAFTCDLQDGDAECTAVTMDTATGGEVVVTIFNIHQANQMEHAGDSAFIKQKKLKMRVIVLNGPVEPEIMAETEAVVGGCKGVATITDLDGNDSQDKAVWSFECKQAAMANFLLSLEGEEAEAAAVAAQEVMASASKKGKVRAFGKDKDGPSIFSELLMELDDLEDVEDID